MQRLRQTSFAICVFVTLWGLEAISAGKVCYLGQEPDPTQSGRLRWVLPGSHEDRCACTSIRPGPFNTQPVPRPHESFYIDTPIFTDDQEDIHDYFDCHDPCDPNPCQYKGKCKKDGRTFRCSCKSSIGGDRCEKPRDCYALYNAHIRESGVYTIYPSQYPEGLRVNCDGEGWIVFQKRFNGSLSFNRNWTEYQEGFGELTGEFWLGNDILHDLGLSYTPGCLLKIELEFDQPDSMLTYVWPFRVEGENYSLVVEGITEDSIETSIAFSTYDRDNDGSNDTNYAEMEKGGWWFYDWGHSLDLGGNLNAEYYPVHVHDQDNSTNFTHGIRWYDDDGEVIAVHSSQMKMRRFYSRDCQRLNNMDVTGSGIYSVYPWPYAHIDKMKVYCDMNTEPRGWMVFQRRFDGSVNFTRNWTEYQDGFGELSGEFWLGNEKLQQLTYNKQWALEIELESQNFSITYRWLSFRVMGNNYDLEINGSIDDFHLPPRETPLSFSTYDRDNDDVNGTNCAEVERAGWWFGDCGFGNDSLSDLNLNGEYSLLENILFEDINYSDVVFESDEDFRVQRSQMKLRRFSPRDCLELYEFGARANGIYTIYLQTKTSVYCDMEANGGGWTVFQRRFDGSVNFTRNWAEYKNGFGELSGEFWLGNEKLQQLTRGERNWDLWIHLEDNQRETISMAFKRFHVGVEDYQLVAGTDFLHKKKFSTYNKDNDGVEDSNCAAEQKGGWWFGDSCCNANVSCSLTGEYRRPVDGVGSLGIQWIEWPNHDIVKCQMKLRRY